MAASLSAKSQTSIASPVVGNALPTEEGIRKQLAKILQARAFRESQSLKNFLRYVVERTLRGEGDQLKEYRLGIEVLERDSSFDPRLDPAVRMTARRLRSKLREYYETQGREDPIRIDIPKGGYGATFTTIGSADVPAAVEKRFHLTSRRAKIALAAGFCVIAFLFAGWAISRERGQPSTATAPQLLSVAVLPLQNRSGDPAQDFLADGITENLIDNLSQIPGLRVMARSTVFRYKDKELDPQKIGEALKVNAVLTGQVLKRGDALVVDAELVDVAKGSRLWGGQYNRKVADITFMQEDIARGISASLRVHLPDQDMMHSALPPTKNVDAFELYLRGRYSWNKRTEEGFTKAIEYFNQAIEKDPHYALAYAGLADSYLLMAEYLVLPSDQALPKARQAAVKALELDETLAEAHTSLAAVKLDSEWDWAGAEQELRRAIELNPGYATAHQWYGELLSQEGRNDEAIAEIKRAQELDPLSLIVNAIAGRILLFAGLIDPAVAQLQKTLEIDPNFSIASYDLGKAYLLEGRPTQAIAEFQKSTNLFRVSERDAALAYAYARFGQESEARHLLKMYLGQSKSSYISWYGIAFIYAGLGEKGEALSCLEKAFDLHDVRLRELKQEPLFATLRSDPRFVHLLRRIGLQP